MRLAEAYGRLIAEDQKPVNFYNHNRTLDAREWVKLTSETCSIGSMVADLILQGDHVWPSLRPFVIQGLSLSSAGQVGFKHRNTEELKIVPKNAVKSDDSDDGDGN